MGHSGAIYSEVGKNCCLDSQIGSNWRVFAVQQKMEHVKNTKNSCAACGIDLFLGCPESLSNLLQNSPPHVENRPRPNLEVCLTNGSIVPSLGSTKKEGRVFQQIYDVFCHRIFVSSAWLGLCGFGIGWCGRVKRGHDIAQNAREPFSELRNHPLPSSRAPIDGPENPPERLVFP